MDLNLENLVENIISLKHLIIKKLFNREITNSIIPQDAQYVLIMLKKNESATMSEIGCELFMPKPNVTVLVDKLVEAQMVERISDSNDRRIVRIKITEKGSEALAKVRNIFKELLKSKLLLLSEDDLNRLADSLNTVNEVMQKIQ